MARRLELRSLQADTGPRARREYEVGKLLSEALGVSLSEAKYLAIDWPLVLPSVWSDAEARHWQERLGELGVQTEIISLPGGTPGQCTVHPRFVDTKSCRECAAPLCAICLRKGEGYCPSCAGEKAKKFKWRRRRIALLLLALLLTASFAVVELRSRRVTWSDPQRVAVVVVEVEQDVPPPVFHGFQAEARQVERVLTREFERYGVAGTRPFRIEVWGPVVESSAPPQLEGNDWWSLLKFNLALKYYAWSLDRKAGLDASNSDVRVYARTRRSSSRTSIVEGLGQQGGELGVVDAIVTPAETSFAWFALMHEVFHTRGATDKYDSQGLALVPEGLADPERQPRYPQERIEMMARGRPVGPREEKPPGPIESWAVGRWTAEEIGWVEADVE